MELALESPLASFEDQQYDGVSALFANESDHMPCLLSFESSDVRFFIRSNAVSQILHAQLSYGLDPFIVYLSVNYIDRFLSKQKILEKKPWIARILVVASLSLAAKMRNCNLSVSLSDLKREKYFEFDAHSIRRMEAIVLGALEWRMRSITPFSFLHYFISLFEIDDSSLIVALKQRASCFIINLQYELKFLQYKPSTIAASALLCATQDLIPLKFTSFKDEISSCEYVNQERWLDCLRAMQEMLMNGYESNLHASPSCTLTPVSVLDLQRTRRSESEYDTTCNSVILDTHSTNKRRRLNGLSGNRTFKISQTQQC
ncbi:putative cyclin-D6-1 [Olea europaea var. sylvestris]|uniref:Cyclin-D6-1 isoform X1 n=1 Tax=Olea europaea subsp. europaea TaxID=158383 RepID=A0A8S0TJI3_OLEEU|nr:putative cyclin-D6-1 [Olea europaea var. sylvestris]CAA3005865.1 cyclin-D6-1 isoform X1 [Olea europaea subsp. europaea]